MCVLRVRGAVWKYVSVVPTEARRGQWIPLGLDRQL